jgi:hypothetical protein
MGEVADPEALTEESDPGFDLDSKFRADHGSVHATGGTSRDPGNHRSIA